MAIVSRHSKCNPFLLLGMVFGLTGSYDLTTAPDDEPLRIGPPTFWPRSETIPRGQGKAATQRFIQAVKKNDIVTLGRLLPEIRINVNARDDDSMSALDYAVQNENTALVRSLMVRGANLQLEGNAKHVIYRACDRFKSGRVESMSSNKVVILQILLRDHMRILIRTLRFQNRDPLHYACSDVHSPTLVDLLLPHFGPKTTTLTAEVRTKLLERKDGSVNQCLQKVEEDFNKRKKSDVKNPFNNTKDLLKYFDLSLKQTRQ